jgi:thiol-disulfide isomerase/thioredoxin
LLVKGGSEQTKACACRAKRIRDVETGILLGLILLLTCFLTSCARGEKSSAGATQVGQEFPLTPADEGRLRAVLQKNRGQVVVLNFWATWCEPCREEFPDLLKLHENYRLKGLDLILLSMDDADQVQEVKKFLREKAVNFESYIRSGGDFEAFVNSIDPNWIGGIPATFVFDRQGNRIASLFGAQNYGKLAGAVCPLL